MLPRRGRLLLRVLAELVGDELSDGLRVLRGRQEPGAADRGPRLRAALESLGPLYIKVGQILSTRPDLIPPAVASQLEGLHDSAPAIPFPRLRPVLDDELGSGWPQRFSHFDTSRPLGSASLAQAYGATLHDGLPVVVKVQRPGVLQTMAADMRLVRRITRLFARGAPVLNATIDFDAMLAVIFDAMRHELDFTLEAANMERAREEVRSPADIQVPRVVHATPHILIQTRAPGTSIRDADPADFKEEERERIGTDLIAFMYRGYFTHRFFHADPHPGNIFVTPGGPTTMIDWGMVGRIDRQLSMSLMMTLLGLAHNDARAVARSWTDMGRPTPWADISGFEQDMASLVPTLHGLSLEHLRFGASLSTLLRYSTRRGIQTSPMVGLLGKSFSNVEGAARYLAPQVSVTDVLVRHTPRIVAHYLEETISPARLGYGLLHATAAVENGLADARTFGRSLTAGELTLQHFPVRRRFSLVDHRTDRRLRMCASALVAAAVWRHLHRN
ncbi:AarF/ABC1/UbiB kinase family protein [Streptomyces sp. PTM05]|uniref:AarF/ABC1/UbiB kinase family protein n=1 Tax=Streptantibioticus parmotrematis TaxID=2873249 RepID=A0ABS7QTT7_9ACTN|nr:AarF/UbiB family protein [Streptantibioticus parmotrematis]MBY8886099.1 AarF/ABC1/UbiB kinase family protein [Streptantibioticus parmotrematis]